jgi:SNF2 family DNA or RNA helicase
MTSSFGLQPIIDNQETELEDAYRKALRRSSEARIATGYFYVSGFNLYRDNLENLADPDDLGQSPIRLLMGCETDRVTAEEIKEGLNLRDALRDAVSDDIASLNNAQMDRLDRLKHFIRDDLVDVRVRTKEAGSFHAKGASFRLPPDETGQQPAATIVGSSNFSKTGHTDNVELNLASRDENKVQAFEEWFDSQWANSQEFSEDLIEIIESDENYQVWKQDQESKDESSDNDLGTYIEPFEFYKLLAYDALDGNITDRYDSPLYHFQHRGYESAKKKLADYNGCIISDSVGLGKSFIGAELLRDYREKHNQNCLLVVPAHLTSQWMQLLQDATDDNGNPFFGLEVDGEHLRVMSITKFQNLDYDDVQSLDDAFDVVLIDEAHRFRNHGKWKANKEETQGTQRYANMSELKGNTMIMLTATPLNNSAEDLKNLINLFTGENELRNLAGLDFDAFDEYIKLATKRKKLLKADEADEADIQNSVDELSSKSEEIGDILDEVMVLRTRKHVKEQLRDEEELEMNFSPPTVHKQRYDLPEAYRPAYEALPEIMDALHLSHITIKNPQGGSTLKALYKLNLLKRLESSPKSFIESLRTLYNSQTLLLNTLQSLPEDEDIRHLQDTDDNKTLTDFTQNKQTAEELKQALEELGFDESIVHEGENIDDELAEATVADVKHFIQEDLVLLAYFASLFITGIAPENQPVNQAKQQTDNWLKENGFDHIPDVEPTEYDQRIYPDKDLQNAVEDLQTFYETIFDIETFHDTKIDLLRDTLNDTDGKAVIFTQYRATADYIYQSLLNDPDAPLTDTNSAVIKGGDEHKQDIVKRFAPEATGYQTTLQETNEEELRYVVATDTLSEGVNLQDVDTAVNYDLPWNPMRIVQRVGRIDRIGTEADKHVYNFFPDEDLEAAIKLLKRLRAKINDIALIVGKENNILDPNEDKVLERANIERQKTIGEIELEEIKHSIHQSRETDDINDLDDTTRNAILQQTSRRGEKEAFERIRLKQDLQDKHNLAEDDFDYAQEYFQQAPQNRPTLHTVFPNNALPEARVLGLMHLWHEDRESTLNRKERDLLYTHKNGEIRSLNTIRQINIDKDMNPSQDVSYDEVRSDIQTINEEVESRTESEKATQLEGAYKQGSKKSVDQNMLIDYFNAKLIPQDDHAEQAENLLKRLKQPNLKSTEEESILRQQIRGHDKTLPERETKELLNTVEAFLDEHIEDNTDYQTDLVKQSEVKGAIQGCAIIQ